MNWLIRLLIIVALAVLPITASAQTSVTHSTMVGQDLHQAFHYEQTSDPGNVGTGKWWFQTSTRILFRRNAGNTDWDQIIQLPDADLTTIAGLVCNDGQILKKVSGLWACGTDLTGSSSLNVTETFALSGDISPPQITSDQDDYNPTGLSTAGVLRLTTDVSRQLKGLQGGTDGRVLILHYVGSSSLVLANQAVSSGAANRFAIGANITLAADQGIIIQYDQTASRWRAASAVSGGGGGAPIGAGYITTTPDGTLSAEFAMSLLATGLVKNITGTGVPVIATPGTDYYAPGSTDVAVVDGGTGSSTAGGARTNLSVPSIDEVGQGDVYYISDGGASDAYTGCPVKAFTAYKTGMIIWLKPNTSNTGAASLNACSLGVKNIKDYAGNDPVNSALTAGKVYPLYYDGTNFNLLNVGLQAEVDTPQSIFNRAKQITSGANSFANRFGVGDGGAGCGIYVDAGNPTFVCWPASGVENDLDHNEKLAAGKKKQVFNSAAAPILVLDETTGALTNVKLDCAGTGNVCTSTSKIWLPAAGGTAASPALLWNTLASNAPTASCTAGATETTKLMCWADFPDADGDYSLQQDFAWPSDWTAANVDAQIYWKTTAITGNAVFQITFSCAADGAVEDVSFNAASTVTDTAKGVASQINIAAINDITLTGCSATSLADLKLFRNRTHANDTLLAALSVKGVMLTLRRAQ